MEIIFSFQAKPLSEYLLDYHKNLPKNLFQKTKSTTRFKMEEEIPLSLKSIMSLDQITQNLESLKNQFSTFSDYHSESPNITCKQNL